MPLATTGNSNCRNVIRTCNAKKTRKGDAGPEAIVPSPPIRGPPPGCESGGFVIRSSVKDDARDEVRAEQLRRLGVAARAGMGSAPCGGRTQGTAGMMDSLPYGNDAAIVSRRLTRSLPRRKGVLGVATCDKGLPAMMLALAGTGRL